MLFVCFTVLTSVTRKQLSLHIFSNLIKGMPKRKLSSSLSCEDDGCVMTAEKEKISKSKAHGKFSASGKAATKASEINKPVSKKNKPRENVEVVPRKNLKDVIVPKRKENGDFIFMDEPKFKPNLSPKEVLQAGSFGGTYFRPIKSGVTKKSYGEEVWEELPADWLEGLNITKQVASPTYDINVNKYKAKCGSSLEAWESSNWIRAQDPYGWFQWYCRFFQGRRSEDDERQIGRWLRCTGQTGRWRNNLISKIYRSGAAYDDYQISPVVRQVLHHWAYRLTKKHYEEAIPRLNKKIKQ